MTDQLNHTEVRFNLKIQGRCHQLEEEGIPDREAGLNKATVQRHCGGTSKKVSAARVSAAGWGELGKEHGKEVCP